MRQIGDTGIENGKLRDEIFCQIIKQITDNAFECVSHRPPPLPLPAAVISRAVSTLFAIRSSLLHGWEILAIMCGLYQPGRELLPYLQVRFTAHTTHAHDTHKTHTRRAY
jgi:hypothetical protein